MTGGQKDLIHYRMERAEETLQEARLMLENGHFHGAANRIHYACFYAVTALLLTRGLSSPKHRGIMALFNRPFVRKGIVSVDMGRFYAKTFDDRLEGDYGDVVELSEEDVKADFRMAQEFITQISSLLESV